MQAFIRIYLCLCQAENIHMLVSPKVYSKFLKILQVGQVPAISILPYVYNKQLRLKEKLDPGIV